MANKKVAIIALLLTAAVFYTKYMDDEKKDKDIAVEQTFDDE